MEAELRQKASYVPRYPVESRRALRKIVIIKRAEGTVPNPHHKPIDVILIEATLQGGRNGRGFVRVLITGSTKIEQSLDVLSLENSATQNACRTKGAPKFPPAHPSTAVPPPGSMTVPAIAPIVVPAAKPPAMQAVCLPLGNQFVPSSGSDAQS